MFVGLPRKPCHHIKLINEACDNYALLLAGIQDG